VIDPAVDRPVNPAVVGKPIPPGTVVLAVPPRVFTPGRLLKRNPFSSCVLISRSLERIDTLLERLRLWLNLRLWLELRLRLRLLADSGCCRPARIDTNATWRSALRLL
jgi:hypothetical protein